MGKMEHLLVTYSSDCAKNGHVDPNFTQMVYGDSKTEGNVIKSHLAPGSYVFFNTNVNGERYITAYFYVEKILNQIENKMEIDALNCSAKEDEVVVIGSRLYSKILTLPLKLDKQLLIELKSFGIDNQYFIDKMAQGYNELQAIAHKTYNNKLLSDMDKNLLLQKCKDRG
jgi:hypothetical protein